MRLFMTTLSPVHIGSGDKYTGLSHLPERNVVYVYDAERIMHNLGDYAARFASWIEERVAEIDRLDKELKAIERGNKQQQWKRKRDEKRQAERKLSLRQFLQDIKDKSVEQRFKRPGEFLHCLNVPQGVKIYPSTEIDQLIRMNVKPYIPGTEIKGAMRTAILYSLLKHNSILYNSLRDDLVEFQEKFSGHIKSVANERGKRVPKKKKPLVKAMGKLEERLQHRLLFGGSRTDAQYDLFRFVAVADSNPVDADTGCFVTNIIVVGLSRNVITTQELFKEGMTFECTGFNVGSPKSDLLSTVSVLEFAPDRLKVISNYHAFFACCREFSERLLDEEIAYFSGRHPNIAIKLQEIKHQNTVESPVLRLGKGEGFLSLTVGLLVKDKDRRLYDEVVSHATKNISYTGYFPKTRRIVDMGNGEYHTLGWVKLSVVENGRIDKEI